MSSRMRYTGVGRRAGRPGTDIILKRKFSKKTSGGAQQEINSKLDM